MEQDIFMIYQVKTGDETRDLRFEPFDKITAAGLKIDRANYDLVYTAPFENMTLNDIFERFNIDHPEDYAGRSVSVSDVIVLRQSGRETAYYVDSFGFKETPEFLGGGHYYKINEQTARRAKEANSFSDYKPGSATAEYRELVDQARELAEQQKRRVDPLHHEKINRLLDTYARKLADNLNERSAIDARVPSILISGGGNFPVAKKHKQNAARDRNMGEYMEIKGLLDKIRGAGMGGISADDLLAVEKLEAKLAGLIDSQEQMKTVNAYYRKHKTLDGCLDLSEHTINELKASMSRDWRKDPVPFPEYALSNNNANMRQVKQRIEDLKNRCEFAGWTFAGGRAEVNETENRLQLFFDEKPTAEQRDQLKGHGFKWAPSQGAWQRQLTKNAIHSCGSIDFIKPADGKTPWQHQPFARKPEQDISER